MVNRRTAPKRCVSQPVSGTEMALATPKLVMTQVPWLGLTPTSPEIAGMATLAMDESSTFMKVASDRASVPSTSCVPLSGSMRGGMAGAGGAAPELLASAEAGEVVVMVDPAPAYLACAAGAAGAASVLAASAGAATGAAVAGVAAAMLVTEVRAGRLSPAMMR